MEPNINSIDLVAPQSIAKKRKSPLGSIIWIAAGAAIAATRYFVPSIAASADISSAVMIVGWTLAIFGMIKLVIVLSGSKSFDYYYIPTNEKLKLHELSYDLSHKDTICAFTQKGEFDKIAAIDRSSISSVKLSFYATPSREVKWAQVFEFVPHTHIPVTEVIAYEKCPLPQAMA